jgi:hypothetical protein
MTAHTLAITRTWHHRLSQVSQLRRVRGSKRTLYALIRRILMLPILNRCVNVYAGDLWQIDLSGRSCRQTTLATRIPKSYQVRLANQSDLPKLADYYGDEQTVEDRLVHGDLCFMTLCQGDIGAAVWLVYGPGECHEDWDELRLSFQFPTGFAWTYAGKGTRMGAWGTLMKQLPVLLTELEINSLVTVIDCDNWQSHDAHQSLGYQKTGLIGSVRLFGFHWAACRPANHHWQLLPTCIGSVECSD